jgi:phosphoribosylanthranilate isomerase
MRVKVCGNTALDTALVAVDAGADALGFIMAPGTPRSLTPERARAIVRSLPADVDTVGVFVDRPVEEVADVAATVGFTIVQLHGVETWAQAGRLDMPVIKGVRLAAAADAAAVDWPPGSILLADSHDPGLPGGTGRAFPWHWAADLALRYRLVVSGGLSAENVGAAIQAVRPWGVDASSRLESSPGVKDPARVRAYVAAARRAEAELVAGGAAAAARG